MDNHRLKREIIVTQLSNYVINEMGINFVSRLQEETGYRVAEIIRAYTVSREIFNIDELMHMIQELDLLVDLHTQHFMLSEITRLVRRTTRWFLRNRSSNMDVEQTIAYFKPKLLEFSHTLSQELEGSIEDNESSMQTLTKANVPFILASRISKLGAMFASLDVVEAAMINKLPVTTVGSVYYAIGTKLQLEWFRALINQIAVKDHWDALARAALRDDADRQQRNLTVNILLLEGQSSTNIHELIQKWVENHEPPIKRWIYFVDELKSIKEINFTMLAVALKELSNIIQLSAAVMT